MRQERAKLSRAMLCIQETTHIAKFGSHSEAVAAAKKALKCMDAADSATKRGMAAAGCSFNRQAMEPKQCAALRSEAKKSLRAMARAKTQVVGFLKVSGI